MEERLAMPVALFFSVGLLGSSRRETDLPSTSVTVKLYTVAPLVSGIFAPQRPSPSGIMRVR